MNTLSRYQLIAGALCGFVTVALGAFGAHALRASLSNEMMAVWQTAVQYQGLHSAALLLTGLLGLHFPSGRWIRIAGWLMLAGIVLFSGSLYLMALSGLIWLGFITPLGGVCLLAGWAALVFGLLRRQASKTP
ncbi:DUF423 domain-containing protein [Sedimenticola sp.]|uniref:DUF423 domain-containing protein n=1 Tax=Sedimenticola sp. TaxID=1940285 RepID=UPI003D0E799D